MIEKTDREDRDAGYPTNGVVKHNIYQFSFANEAHVTMATSKMSPLQLIGNSLSHNIACIKIVEVGELLL